MKVYSKMSFLFFLSMFSQNIIISGRGFFRTYSKILTVFEKIVEKKKHHTSRFLSCTQHERKCSSIELLQLRSACLLASTHKRSLPERFDVLSQLSARRVHAARRSFVRVLASALRKTAKTSRWNMGKKRQKKLSCFPSHPVTTEGRNTSHISVSKLCSAFILPRACKQLLPERKKENVPA